MGLIVGSLFTPSVARAAFPGGNGLIAYVRAGSIWIANANGTGQHQISTAGGWSGPAWSPNGQRIAAARNGDIFTFSPTFSSVTQVTTNTHVEQDPAWSPDGQRLAFASDRTGHFHIYTIHATVPFGSPPQITTIDYYYSDTNSPVQDTNPAWSLNGSTIMFARRIGGITEPPDTFVSRRAANGSGSDIDTTSADARSPDFAPNGTKIAYTLCPNCDVDVAPAYIDRANLNGSSPVHIVTDNTDGVSFVDVAWAPSGTKLLFSYLGANGVRIVNSNGTNNQVLIANGKQANWQRLT